MKLPTWTLVVLLLVMNTLHGLVAVPLFSDGSALWLASSLAMAAIANILGLFGQPAVGSLHVPAGVNVLVVVAADVLHGVIGFKGITPHGTAWIVCTVLLILMQNAAVLLGQPIAGGADKSGGLQQPK